MVIKWLFFCFFCFFSVLRVPNPNSQMLSLEADLNLLEHPGIRSHCVTVLYLLPWTLVWPFELIFSHLTKNVSTTDIISASKTQVIHWVKLSSILAGTAHSESCSASLCVPTLFMPSLAEHCGKQRSLPPSVCFVESEVYLVIRVILTQGEF